MTKHREKLEQDIILFTKIIARIFIVLLHTITRTYDENRCSLRYLVCCIVLIAHLISQQLSLMLLPAEFEACIENNAMRACWARRASLL